jgi:glutathione-regulated potassium-efflux system ancillary protein KefF
VILLIHAHPYPRTSRAGAALLEAIRDVPTLEVRSLYELYPDFDIDVAAEQAALERAQLVALLHPLYWYTVPGLLKHWMDEVLVGGWAHGKGGTALRGKSCLWITTAGDVEAYTLEGRHHHRFEDFVPVVEQTARYCGMNWLKPFVVHGAHEISDDELRAKARELRAQLVAHA